MHPATPTPAELRVWAQVAGVPGAEGHCLVHRRTGSGWWAGSGGPPVVTAPPVGVPFSFAYGGGRQLRIGDAVTDGSRAVVVEDGEVRTGHDLLVLGDPRHLLEPAWPHHPRRMPRDGGNVERDDLLERVTWRWTSGSDVRWFDEETGILLREQTAAHDLELVELQIGTVDPHLFVVPGAGPVEEGPEVEELDEGDPGFDVPWWPRGCPAYHVAGDPDVPEVLLTLVSDDHQVQLGIAPEGHEPRAGEGQARRWSGDGWEFVLSWTGDLRDVDEVVASIPRSWS